jgi:hypothetical protein
MMIGYVTNGFQLEKVEKSDQESWSIRGRKQSKRSAEEETPHQLFLPPINLPFFSSISSQQSHHNS